MPGFTDSLKLSLIINWQWFRYNMTAKQLINSILATFTFDTNIIDIILKLRKLKILCYKNNYSIKCKQWLNNVGKANKYDIPIYDMPKYHSRDILNC